MTPNDEKIIVRGMNIYYLPFNLQIEIFLKDNLGSYVELILVVQKVMDTCDVDFGYLSPVIENVTKLLQQNIFNNHKII